MRSKSEQKGEFKMSSSTTKVVISIIMALTLAFGAGSIVGKVVACELEEQGWETPDLEGLKAEGERIREKEGKIYKNEVFILNNTFLVGRLSCEGNIFTFAFDENMDGKIDYWLVDGDGDGIFENLCYSDEEAIIPEWVKK
jgi:hypothetical protein